MTKEWLTLARRYVEAFERYVQLNADEYARREQQYVQAVKFTEAQTEAIRRSAEAQVKSADAAQARTRPTTEPPAGTLQ